MKNKEKALLVIVASTDKVLWSGIALSVSSVNSDGPFDILGGHANFITLIDNKPIKVVTIDKKTMTFTFKQAIIFIVSNLVKIYAEE
jgi:F0F1-type ATP synthase epsilon subunit